MKCYPSIQVPDAGTITGNLTHTGTSVGFYGTTPTAQTTGVAQLTDNSGGSANDTIQAMADVGVDVILAADQSDVNNRLAAIRNNFADVTSKLNTVLTALKDLGLIAN